MSHGGSRRAVVVALLANLGIAIAKSVAAVITGSGSMLAEAIHSFADSGNQGLLLIGDARSKRPASPQYPLGHGREAYFWALIVAMVLFGLGGLFSGYEGIHKLLHPEPLDHIGWAVGVLLVSIVLETTSFRAAWAEVNRVRSGKAFYAWARTTSDVNLLVVTFEDLAALVGLFIALAAVGLAWLTGNSHFDAIGSLALSLLLFYVSVFLALQVRRLITGHSVDPETHAEIEKVWTEHGFRVLLLTVMWTGPRRLSVALKVCPRDLSLSTQVLIERMNAAEAAVRAAVPDVAMQFSEPDTEA